RLPASQVDRPPGAAQVGSAGDHPPESGRPRPLEDLLLLALKRVVGQVKVAIHPEPVARWGHFTRLPGGSSSCTVTSPSSPAGEEAARIMPWESSPRRRAGFRLATTTTFRPTSSSGRYAWAM